MKWLSRLTPHALTVLCLMFAVFLVLDEFNPMMNFIDNGISRVLLGILCGAGVLNAALLWHAVDAKK